MRRAHAALRGIGSRYMSGTTHKAGIVECLRNTLPCIRVSQLHVVNLAAKNGRRGFTAMLLRALVADPSSDPSQRQTS